MSKYYPDSCYVQHGVRTCVESQYFQGTKYSTKVQFVQAPMI